MKEKRELVRIVRTPDGHVLLDNTGKASGRGVYICKSVQCLEKSRKSKALSRALDTPVDDSVFAELEKEING